MNLTKLTYLFFFVVAFMSLVVAFLFERKYQIYIQPFTIIAIFIIYATEKKAPFNILYVLALIFSMIGGIFLIFGHRAYVPEVCLLFSFFYIMYLRLMYLKNEKKETTSKLYFFLILIFLPVVYLYDIVIELVYREILSNIVYFIILIFFIFSYIITAIYYYLQNKNQSNLWMLIAAANLGIMNILIMINQLYLYDAMFTVIILCCSHSVNYFSMKFMLENNENSTADLLE